MKKNKMMRIASVLLVAVLISTCAISGTFAKYVTRVEGTDTARVAKWGILLTVDGDGVFAQKYAKDDEDYSGEFSVVSNYSTLDDESDEMDKVVAPGTKGALKATVNGTPEVATRYTLKIDKDWSDIVLPAGTYTDYTNYVLNKGYTNTFDLEADYAPVKWDITIKNSNGKTVGLLTEAAKFLDVDVATLNAAGVRGFSVAEAKEIITTHKAALETLVDGLVADGHDCTITLKNDGSIEISMDFDPNAEMDYEFALTWAWAFEGPTAYVFGTQDMGVFDAETVDQADTLLGNLIAAELDDNLTLVVADGAEDPTETASLVINASLTATATQID